MQAQQPGLLDVQVLKSKEPLVSSIFFMLLRDKASAVDACRYPLMMHSI